MKGNNLRFPLAAIGGLTFLLACGGENTADNTELNVVDSSSTEMTDEFAAMFESPESDYQLPSPLQVASIFKKSGLSYNSAATNKPTNIQKYTTELEQMLNFGVYSADMAYCVMNEQSNEGRKFLDAITDLAEKIGMEAVFENKDLIDRFDKNIENKDSIEFLMIDIHERTESYVDENDMQHQQAIHFSGAWTEGMYLGVYDFEKNPSKEGVGKEISEQMLILENIIKGLKDPKNEGMDIDWLIQDMEKIQVEFNNFKSVKNYNSEDNTVDELVLEKSESDALGKLIKALRNKITKG